MTEPALSDLSLEDKAALGSGADFWTTKAVGSVPSLMLTDGPHGVRKQTGASDHLGLAGSEPATCFPPAVGLGQSWDTDLVHRVGEALGREARALGVDVLLGPGVNIKRDPRCGRNFEYLSEDPVVAGVLGAAWVTGVQSVGVGTSLKHFALNNAETDRMRSSSDIDPRPMHEIYLRAFAHVVRTARPWTVMCSYNRINGVYAAENPWLLTELLRETWGFDGAVVSDWGAVRDRVAAVRAGLDLEMPGAGTAADAEVVEAVRAGELSPNAVDRAAAAVAGLAHRVHRGRENSVAADLDAHHRLAREAAARSIVLLKNDTDLLPLAPGTSIAVLGAFAQSPRYQGGGSSHVNPTRLDIPLDEIRAQAGTDAVTFAPGFTTDGSGDATALRDDAVRTVADAEVAVLFLGLGDDQESEGFDREHIEIPSDQRELVSAVVQVQPRTVVVLAHGGVLRLAPIAEVVPAILDGALLGQAGGGAIADVLFGAVNPSGRLTETVPVRLQDCPSYLDFPGENSHVRYGEGIHVGYRGYDARGLDVTFPFGHGLSYTDFDHTDLSVTADDTGIDVDVTVTNTGDRAGREVVQVYVTTTDSRVTRPPRELKGFATTPLLEPAASERVSIRIDRSDLAYWDVRRDDWTVEDGDYVVAVGASSRDLRVTDTVHIMGDDDSVPITWQSTLAEALTDPVIGKAIAGMMPAGASDGGDALGTDIVKIMGSMPLDRLARFGIASGALTELLGDGA
ncbi:beta-glucosidase [Williamsia sp. Leaf354]|jgi:beta-glucosidase|uniref:glycoside hydrolase family 3 C-terminal domain-containing protein n=1 Tax=Williamsia sp. Leaf354 TaxID=1736349 RepID=UPI0006F729A7|nr:glycoside hydrolase family 3 C-terminal domain-containing protein [Williamsia sp. Leaf354]KQR96506.1 beta-glucosidase [Williamsia sp. Leaf354]